MSKIATGTKRFVLGMHMRSAVGLAGAVLLVCAGSMGGVMAAEISQPPTMNKVFGTRNPRKCENVTHVPSAAEAAALSQCNLERQSHDFVTLWQDVKVQVGGPRPYAYDADSRNPDIDTTTKVYPIRATADLYVCGGEKTCTVEHVTNGHGTCYKTTFGDWNCSFSSGFNANPTKTQLPRPTTY